MTTMAFNEGVDLYGRGENDAAKRWITEAMNLAHYVDDDGVLQSLVHEKFLTLTWAARPSSSRYHLGGRSRKTDGHGIRLKVFTGNHGI